MNAKRFRKRFALLIPTLVIIFFFIGFLFAPNDPMKSNLLARYADPSAEYPFGTDALGRCILSRILYGGWTTLGIVLGGSLIVFSDWYCYWNGDEPGRYERKCADRWTD